MAGGRRRRGLALVCLGLALMARLAAPDWPGFWLLALALGLFLAAGAGVGRWRTDLAALFSPAGRAQARLAAGLILGLGLALAAGRAGFGPALDFSRGRDLTLSSETLALLARLDRPVTITVRLGSQDPREPRVRELLGQFRRAAGAKLTVVFLNPQTEAERDETGPRLVEPGSALVAAEAFRENVPALTEEALSGALTRLLTPGNRLVYCLSTFGEKPAQEVGP
ncbi:MAG: GldG family protein, partial [Candidatus Adiutrix sp.]|nr:GldG family protein [Candidatus Adiutrix sp.]